MNENYQGLSVQYCSHCNMWAIRQRGLEREGGTTAGPSSGDCGTSQATADPSSGLLNGHLASPAEMRGVRIVNHGRGRRPKRWMVERKLTPIDSETVRVRSELDLGKKRW